MHISFKELLEKLAIHRTMSAYETHPWFYYDEDKEITCSAEVRIGPSASTLQAEIQFVYDEAEDGKPNPEQIMLMSVEKSSSDLWTAVGLIVKKQDYVNKIGSWEEKGYKFFQACVSAIQMGELPDIDKLIEKELSDDDGGGGRRGRIGRKSPKVNPAALAGMKR